MKFKNFLIIALIFFASCAIFEKARAPKFDANAATMAQSLNTQVDNLYKSETSAADKSYVSFQSQYSAIDNAIAALVTYDQARKHSTALMIIVNDIKARFSTYEAEHQSYGKLNNSQILAYKEGMDALLDILYRTEANYKH